MIAYDKTALDNSFLIDEAQNLESSGFITEEQYLNAKSKLKALKTNKNLLVRFGFFLLGCLMYSSCSSLFAFLLYSMTAENYEISLFFISCLGIGGLEILSRSNHWGYGLDDAFLLGFLLMLGVSVGISSSGDELVIASVITIASIFTYIRYVHVASALIACLSITATIAFASFELGPVAKNLLPFIIMLFVAVFYFVSKNSLAKLEKPYYHNGILLINNFCLIVFYLSGNYLVVRELSAILLETEIPPTQEITFAPFFYAFTFVVPVAYLFFALKNRNRLMLWIGFLTLAFSFYTIRYYYALLPIEIALTLGGIVLFALSYFTIKRIRENEDGISFKPDRFSNTDYLSNAEILIAATQLGIKPEAVVASKITFGGGDFSGGGSSGSF